MGNNQSEEEHLPTLPIQQTTLDLSNQQLQQFPVKIPSKNKITTLNISNNYFTHLPTKLKKLQKLIIENNNLNQIPSQFEKAFTHMKHLEQLDLAYNNLETLPNFICEMPHLKRIELRGNKFSEIPEFLPGLEFVDLSQNKFDKIPKLPTTVLAVFYSFNHIKIFNPILPKVLFIFCSMNQITTINSGFIFERLNTLDLSMNLLTNDSIPQFKIIAPSVQKVDLSFNKLTVFPEFSSSLKELNLSYNQIESIPDIDESFPVLEALKVTNNLVETVGKLPESLTVLFLNDNRIKSFKKSNLPNLDAFVIFGNKLEKPPDFGSLKIKEIFFVSNKLKSFDIDDSSKKSSHHDELSSQISLKIDPALLTRINLGNNKLDKINPSVFDLPNLIYLNVEKNLLTNLPKLVSRSKLLFLNISENPFEKLKFDLPETIMTFYCSSCKLKEIPESFKDCPSLCILLCMDNEIEKIPYLPCIGILNASNNKIKKFPVLPKGCQQVDLSLNKIEKIPDEINEIDALVELDLSYNKLSKLPDIQNLTNLVFLKLSHNENLKGEIDIQPFKKLETFDISFTKMTVCDIPIEVIRELIISMPSEESTKIDSNESSSSLVFSYPQIKVMTESEFVAYSEMRGSRETMEDSILVRPFICNGCDVYALLDGHGGSTTSNYGCFKLAELFMQNKDFGDDHKFGPSSEEFVRKIVCDLVDSLKIKKFEDGATLALAVFSDEKIVAANLGDSRVMLIGDDGTIKFSSQDHKPVFRDEIERILSVGGKIVNGRVDGVLAVSRCLGDFSIRGVCYEPDVVVHDVEEDDRWLVLCCDGVFDVVSNEDVAEIAKTAKSASDLAYRLRNTAAVRLSTDNISAIAVDLKERKRKVEEMKE